ncbi:MAG: hypothetical protein JKY42_04225 [Flavobacteriales bacterium]|nr:hypothetical protein [Flavobacteriales bacterium]
MLYFLLFIEINLTTLFLYRRIQKYRLKKNLINPNNEPKDSHNLIKSGKTKRLERERQRYVYSMVKIFAIGLVVITATLFWYSHQIVKQHRKDGLISVVLVDKRVSAAKSYQPILPLAS